MKNIFTILFTALIPIASYAQTGDTAFLINSRMLEEIHGRDTIYIPMPVEDGAVVNGTKYTFVERMPVPTIDVTQYLATHMVYPKDALKNYKQGKVMVKFVVTKMGKTADASIVKSCYPSLDTEALRLIENMPDWTPGRDGGKPIDVFFTLPVIFELPK